VEASVRRIVDSTGNEMESCPHPQQIIYVDLGEELNIFDILRRKE
jgi:putative protease